MMGLAIFVFAVFVPFLSAENFQFEDDTFKSAKNYFKTKGSRWSISPGINGGLNKMVSGYDNYEDLGKVGIDVYFRPPLPTVGALTWKDKMMFRASVDYFPLQVPDGTFGLTEDIYALTGTMIIKRQNFFFDEADQLIPFLGIGAGIYWDRIELDTPASGKVTGMDAYFGVTGSFGFLFPTVSNLQFVPEIRFHGIRSEGNFWATHVTYQAGLILWWGRQAQGD